MSGVLIAAALADMVLGPMVAEGKATRYSKGVMPEVVAARARWGHIDLDLEHTGYVALADSQYLGERVMLEANGKLYGPLLVADCAQQAHMEYLANIGFAVDLSWELAQQIGVIDAPLQGVKVYLWDD